jgi:hypothetical protein
MAIIGPEYVYSFLHSASKYDYAREPIQYPRVCGLPRMYSTDTIQRGYDVFDGRKVRLRPLTVHKLRWSICQPREEDGLPECFQNADGEMQGSAYWFLVTYPEHALVDFLQLDIDRHTVTAEHDQQVRAVVSKLDALAHSLGFDIVWTTSPGFRNADHQIEHGLYAWIKLDRLYFVEEIRPLTDGLLSQHGLAKIEHCWQAPRRLLRLPGQQNVEIADPLTFVKCFDHDPKQAITAFQQAWISARPAPTSLLLTATESDQNSVACPSHTCVQKSSVTPGSTQKDKGDTFRLIQQVASKHVHAFYPHDLEKAVTATENEVKDAILRPSKTVSDLIILHEKVHGVVEYFWHTFDRNIRKHGDDQADSERFEPHRQFIESHRNDLLSRVPERLRAPTEEILDKLVAYRGRLAARAIYHGKVSICSYRNWRLIRERLGLVEIDGYTKTAPEVRGMCKQWGLAELTGSGAETNAPVSDALSSQESLASH